MRPRVLAYRGERALRHRDSRRRSRALELARRRSRWRPGATRRGRFRLYLSRPSTTAPLFGEHAAGEIGDTLAQMGTNLAA